MESSSFGFHTIQYRPVMMQYVISNLYWLLLFVASVICMGSDSAGFHSFGLFCSGFLGLYLALELIAMRRTLFVLTSQTLVYDRGIFSRRADFIELYRVIDFQESQSFLQQLVGLKTVVVYSGDRTTPRLIIPGIRQKENLIEIIRARSEFHKERKAVYEITNRF